MMSYCDKKGFTLIELMIAIAIISILSAIAYPSYLEHQQRVRRVQAQADLIELAAFMERFFTVNNSYQSPALPLGRSPRNPAEPLAYTLRFQGQPTATTYQIEAVPAGDQTNDVCGTLSINHLGVRTPANGGCWRF